jgi:hypothetical protein
MSEQATQNKGDLKMQTPTQIAFAKAGVKPKPVNRQIWSYLKRNPEKTSKEVAQGLAITYAYSSCLLSTMQRQGTVGAIGTRPEIYYALGERYKPAKKRGTQKAKAPAVQQALKYGADLLRGAPAISAPAVPEPIKLDGVLNYEVFDRYTLGELRHIHTFLSTIFAGRPPAQPGAGT